MTQHRVMLAKRFHTFLDLLNGHAHSLSHFLLTFQIVRNELMQRRIEQTNGNRTSGHSLEDTLKVLFLIRKDLRQRFLTTFSVLGQDHLTHSFDLLTFEEHMLRTAKANTNGTEATSDRSVVRRISVCTNLQFCIFIG